MLVTVKISGPYVQSFWGYEQNLRISTVNNHPGAAATAAAGLKTTC
jgi:hypothetical protein